MKRAFNKALGRPRNVVLFPKPKKTDSNVVRFITTYSEQHEQIRSIIQKHWHILSTDPILAKYLGPRPEIIFRCSWSIKDHLVHSQYHKSENKQQDQLGLLRCGTCDFCHLLIEGTIIPLPNGHTHSLWHHVSCQTRGVIYIIFCQNGAFYVGKTIRPFWRRIKDHV